jgi:exo-beta-1,3-glucanase (GH17 family)
VKVNLNPHTSRGSPPSTEVGVVKSIVVGKEAIFRIGMGIEQVASAISLLMLVR